MIEQLGDSELNYLLSDTMIKFNDINNYFSDDPKYNFSNNVHYKNLYKNLNSSFINPLLNDLRINQYSELIGLGDLEFSINSPLDILNINRTNTADLGAYQHILMED